MRTLIVPCAGGRMTDGLPLYLNRHPDGKLLAVKAIEGVFPESYDRIIFTILKEADEQFCASEILRKATDGKNNISIIALTEKTSGPAETIYETIKAAGVEGEFAVRDSHAFIKLDKAYTGNFIAGLDLTKYTKTIENLRSKSFITLNEQKQILDIVEKHFCSDVISVGFYGFKSTEDFLMAFEHLQDPNYSITKLYLSHVISYLIGYKQRVFHLANVNAFEDWSTIASWQKIQKTYSTCFMDIDAVCGTSIPYENKILQGLATLSAAGVRFVGFTAKCKDTRDVLDYLHSCNINILTIVVGCSFSKEYTLLLDKKDVEALSLEVSL